MTIRIWFFPQVISMHLLNNLSGWSNFPPCKHSINSGATKRNKADFSGKYSGEYLNDMKRRHKWSQVCRKLGVEPKTRENITLNIWLKRIHPLKMRNNVTGSNWLLWKGKCNHKLYHCTEGLKKFNWKKRKFYKSDIFIFKIKQTGVISVGFIFKILTSTVHWNSYRL